MKKIFSFSILMIICGIFNFCSAKDIWIDSGEFRGNPVDYYIISETYEGNGQGFDVTIKTVNKNTGKEEFYRKGKPRLIFTFITMNEQPHFATNINSNLQPLYKNKTASKIWKYCMNNF